MGSVGYRAGPQGIFVSDVVDGGDVMEYLEVVLGSPLSEGNWEDDEFPAELETADIR